MPISLTKLCELLDAGAQRVHEQYHEFHKSFAWSMSELGLTDQLMIGSAAHIEHNNVIFAKGTNENLNGHDFNLKYFVELVPSPGLMFFQAKVMKRNASTYADFFYEGEVGESHDFQLLALTRYAEDNGGSAFYVVYDYTGVFWVNANTVLWWFLQKIKAGVKDGSTWNAEILADLGRKKFADAMNEKNKLTYSQFEDSLPKPPPQPLKTGP